MLEDMRGRLVILQGQYRHKCPPTFFNEVSGSDNCIGGYDPDREDTEEWFMLYDIETLTCHGCGSDYFKLLDNVFKVITKYPTRSKYMSMVRSLENNHVSPIHRRLMDEVINTYGDYFRDDIEEMEDKAYKWLSDNDPVKKARKKSRLIKKTTSVVMEERKTPVVTSTTPKHTSGKKKGLVPKKRKTTIEYE